LYICFLLSQPNAKESRYISLPMTGQHTKRSAPWIIIVLSAVLAGSFFLPWVYWADTSVSGYHMPLGSFFSISEKKSGLGNPFPQFNFATILFWLIPLSAIGLILLTITNKKTALVSVIAGALSLSLATIYILFTDKLLELGVGISLLGSLRFGIYITILVGAGIILAGLPKGSLIKKIALIVAGPLFAWFGFSLVSKSIETEKFGDPSNSRSVYIVNALDLIREFRTNDSLANAKYREKVITVNGRASETEMPNDSTINIKISDSTGSYLIFPFSSGYLTEAKKIKPGDSISVKASCSGGIYSNILSTESITFKRCALNK